MSSPLDVNGAFDAAKFMAVASQLGHTRALGLEYGGHGENWAELSLPWREELVGVPETGVLASGAIVSLVDTASGLSVWVTLGRFAPVVTLNLRLDYLRPAAKGETIHARCSCEKLTRRIGFVRGIAHGGDPNRPIALSSATFMLHR
jgi:uncharacterized protein (TIGR00369 family)